MSKQASAPRKKGAWAFGKLFLFHPSQAADACQKDEALVDGLKVYAALAGVELASAWFNPLSFLDPNAPVRPSHGAGFWINVALWEPILSALGIFFTILLLDWMRQGWLFKKFASAAFWAAVPALLAAYYYTTNFGRGLFIALLAVWAAPSAYLARKVAAGDWRKLAAFLLGLNAIQLLCTAAEYLTVVPLRSKPGFYIVSIASLVWTLASAGTGLRRLCATSSARVVLAFLLAVLSVPIAIALAYLLGLMPEEVLKVVLFA
jgi:hypothetical protein